MFSMMASPNSETSGAWRPPSIVEVVRHSLVRDGREMPRSILRAACPSAMVQHHHPGEDHRARIHLVWSAYFGGAVRGLEDAVAGQVVDVGARGDAGCARPAPPARRQVVASGSWSRSRSNRSGRVNTCWRDVAIESFDQELPLRRLAAAKSSQPSRGPAYSS